MRAEQPDAGAETAVEPYRLTPKLARRVALLSALVVIGFAALFMRLWALQVLAGSQYAARAQANQVREVRVQAPRGPILDRRGNVLVANEPVTSVELSPSGMPKALPSRVAEVRALAHVTGISVRHVTKLILQRRKDGDMLDPIVVRTRATGPMLTYLEERSAQFPGLTLARTYIRRYPHGDLAAQLLGYDGQISQGELKTFGKDGYAPGDVIGQTGVEFGFNAYLRGIPGLARVRVDSLGRPKSPRLLTTAPQQGQSVRLTLDTGLQVAAQNALNDGIQAAVNNGQFAADGGAIVALNPKDGSILALASSPSYNPSVYSGRVTTKALNAQGLGSAQSAQMHNYPGIDRALDATYPPGSAFKPLTAIAALEEHLIRPYKFYPCTGTYTAPQDRSHHVFHNWDPNVDVGMDLPTALAQSCDTYFYAVGDGFYALPPDRGQPLQKWARKFGFGSTTGVDVRPEVGGLVPTIGWKHAMFTRKTDPTNWRIDRLWKPGDSITLAIGQGDLLVTPIQMARLYAAIANGGKLVTPHVLMDVQNPNGTIVPTTAPPAPRAIPGLNPKYLKPVRQGLFMGTHDPSGTSYGVFANFPYSIAGKTGTAQKVVRLPGTNYNHIESQSWWCGYGPTNDPKLVVCAVIENGGEGGSAAAPAAERVFAKFFHVQSAQQTYIHSD
ncbi:MAG TPA: penicillin-binding protein 2 [Gaiellaceae bacterium]|nr:penicillin-binding protein 2 [Gaiellaceae bacterium]